MDTFDVRGMNVLKRDYIPNEGRENGYSGETGVTRPDSDRQGLCKFDDNQLE
jgi:hypothetical protein